MWESSTDSIFLAVLPLAAKYMLLLPAFPARNIMVFGKYHSNKNIQNNLLSRSKPCAMLANKAFHVCYLLLNSNHEMTDMVRYTPPYAYVCKEKNERCVPPHALRFQILWGHCSQMSVFTADQRGEMSQRGEDC